MISERAWDKNKLKIKIMGLYWFSDDSGDWRAAPKKTYTSTFNGIFPFLHFILSIGCLHLDLPVDSEFGVVAPSGQSRQTRPKFTTQKR